MKGWEGLYGRPQGGEVVVFPQDISGMNRTRATNADEPFLRLMPIGRPSRSPWPSFTDCNISLSDVNRLDALCLTPWPSFTDCNISLCQTIVKASYSNNTRE